jgi:hypothetical protein
MQPYTKTDQRLHWLSQVIGKANRTFVPKADAFQNGLNSELDLHLGKFVKMKYIQFPGNHLP